MLPRETRRGVIYFEFYMTRRFPSRFFIICSADMVGISFSGVTEWAYPGVDPLGGSGGAVVVVSVGEVLLSC
jgi:hypothetical protein